MAAYLYEGKLASSQLLIELRSLCDLAFVEPDSMPGSTSFVAGFTQCELEHHIMGAYNCICVHTWASQRRRHQPEHVRSSLPKPWAAVRWSAVRFRNFHLWEQNSGLYWTVCGSHLLYPPTSDLKLIPPETGALASGSQISSRTALLLKCSSRVRKL